MFYHSKYIIYDTGMNVVPVIFSELQTHAEVAQAFYAHNKVIGAGFVFIDKDGKYACYGESVSLKVKSRGEEDSKFLNKYLGVVSE